MVVLGVIALVAFIVGVALWWPKRGDGPTRASLGQGLLTSGVIATALLLVKTSVDTRAKERDQAAAKRERTQEAVNRERDRRRNLRLSAELSRDLTGVTLSGEDLRDFFLVGKRLRQANLELVDLRGNNLFGTDLSDSNLGKAKLQRAILRQAVLEGAQLGEAKLRRADLEQASMSYADARKADFTRARAINAHLRGATLDGRIWLEAT